MGTFLSMLSFRSCLSCKNNSNYRKKKSLGVNADIIQDDGDVVSCPNREIYLKDFVSKFIF